MRQESKVKVHVRNTVIGSSKVLICLPLVETDPEQILAEAEELVHLGPDLIEWRVDGFTDAANGDKCCNILEKLRKILGETPLILTFRINLEGGIGDFSQQTRLAVIKQAMVTGNVDLVDIELCNDEAFKQDIRQTAVQTGVSLIFSHHNFETTPDQDFIRQKLFEAQEQGADIAKIAVMPESPDDVLTLLGATNLARKAEIDIPMITISMADQGVVSRMAGGLFGSDVTFAAGKKSSAPGQVGFEELKSAIKVLQLME